MTLTQGEGRWTRWFCGKESSCGKFVLKSIILLLNSLLSLMNTKRILLVTWSIAKRLKPFSESEKGFSIFLKNYFSALTSK
jgi:hypothetical protein